LVVLVDETAEPIAALNVAERAATCQRRSVSHWCLQVERAMWPLAVVVVDVDAEDVLEVAAVEDQ
jgi:hypothetical protein